MPTGTEKVFSGVCEGVIGTAPRGENGFGYDPLFYVDGKSMAEMTEAERTGSATGEERWNS